LRVEAHWSLTVAVVVGPVAAVGESIAVCQIVAVLMIWWIQWMTDETKNEIEPFNDLVVAYLCTVNVFPMG
jgi:hypothetical protein